MKTSKVHSSIDSFIEAIKPSHIYQPIIIQQVLKGIGYGETLTTDQLQEAYKVIGFGYGFVAVENIETGEKGSFDFDHSPRLYFNYKKHE